MVLGHRSCFWCGAYDERAYCPLQTSRELGGQWILFRIAVLLVSLCCPSLSTIDCTLFPVSRFPALASVGRGCFHPFEDIFPEAFVDPCPVGHP